MSDWHITYQAGPLAQCITQFFKESVCVTWVCVCVHARTYMCVAYMCVCMHMCVHSLQDGRKHIKLLINSWAEINTLVAPEQAPPPPPPPPSNPDTPQLGDSSRMMETQVRYAKSHDWEWHNSQVHQVT